jgi:anti-sigma B factor antagonist
MAPLSAPQLEIAVENAPEAVVLRLEGEVDLATTPQFSSAVSLAAAARPGEPVAIDMAGVDLIDSTGLRVLLDASRSLDSPLVVLRPSREVRRMLELTMLAATIPVVEDLSQIPPAR